MDIIFKRRVLDECAINFSAEELERSKQFVGYWLTEHVAGEFPVNVDLFSGWIYSTRQNCTVRIQGTFQENIDYTVHRRGSVKQNGGQNKKEYYLSIDCFKKLVASSRSKEGDKVRAYLIKSKKRWIF